MESHNRLKNLNFVLIISNVLLSVYLAFRLIDQSKILKYFPLDATNDISSHIGQLWFLKVCGFHNLCTYWYNGYYLFKFYPPGWFFFSYPLLSIFKRPEVATYISIILMLIISFFAIYKIMSLKEKSFLKSWSFFIFLFGNAISISAYFRLGRVTELFGWVVFLILSYFILKYKDKKIDINFIYFIPFYAAMLISHPIVIIPFHFFLLSLFLVKLKEKKELLILSCSCILGLVISSFWWYQFITELSNSRTYDYLPEILARFFDFSGQWVSTTLLITILPLITLIMFYVYYISINKNKKELLFYSPILVLGFLVLTRLSTLIPYLNYVYPEPYFSFFTIFILIFLFFTDFNNLHFLKKIIPSIILICVILSILASSLLTSYYPIHTELEKNTISLLKEVNGSYVIYGSPSNTSYSKAYYSYAAIYYNLSTPSGWSPSELSRQHQDLLKEFGDEFENNNCENIKKIAKDIKLKEIVTYNKFCTLDCGFKEKILKDNICLIRI